MQKHFEGLNDKEKNTMKVIIVINLYVPLNIKSSLQNYKGEIDNSTILIDNRHHLLFY